MAMNTVTKLLLSTAAMTAISFSTPALAGGGVFDKLDPCIEQVDNFHAERMSYLQELDKNVANADTAAVTPVYREAWMKAMRSHLRETFDTLVAPSLKDAGVQDLDNRYKRWFDLQIEAMGTNVDKLVEANFHRELKEVRIEQRASGAAQLQSAKEDLDKACKMDVGNQMLRGTLTAVLAPVNMIARNLEIAKRESGEGAKALAATTGISIDAIKENGGMFGGGLSGGENSFFRKNLGIRF
ncbi:hypothetical protein A1D31_39345 [Bradyrhizobium liaoningense]|nr:hypothetical protein A1D31_39345 [Bradyrhizobium liaoningense]